MKVDHVLILAAGRGTRMGIIGKSLPKVLWPIFDKTLLALQVEFAKKLAPGAKIYANLYHQKELIKNSIEDLDCEILLEEEVLDIGGGIHNLAQKLDYKGNLLILNGDQFLCFDQKHFLNGLSELAQSDVLLFSYKVNSNQLYNALNSENDKLKGIIKNTAMARDQSHQTYTGMALIRLARLKPARGESKFFETVANPNKQNVGIKEIHAVEYWDFGTLGRYSNSMFDICSGSGPLFRAFLIDTAALDPNKLSSGAYNTEHGINLTGKFIKDCKGSIVLSLKDSTEIPSNQVVFGLCTEPIPER